jgi:hypothetical protein
LKEGNEIMKATGKQMSGRQYGSLQRNAGSLVDQPNLEKLNHRVHKIGNVRASGVDNPMHRFVGRGAGDCAWKIRKDKQDLLLSEKKRRLAEELATLMFRSFLLLDGNCGASTHDVAWVSKGSVVGIVDLFR